MAEIGINGYSGPWDDDMCPKNGENGHEPDWSSITITEDGGESYLDVNCKHCRRSGCIGSSETLADNISW